MMKNGFLFSAALAATLYFSASQVHASQTTFSYQRSGTCCPCTPAGTVATVKEPPVPKACDTAKPSLSLTERQESNWTTTPRYKGEAVTTWTLTEEEQAFLEKLNEERARLKRPLVSIDLDLSRKCREWSQTMSRSGFRHGGGSENIARGTTTGTGVFRMWWNSSGHQRNMMNPRWETIGIGVHGNYWTFRGGQTSRTVEKTVTRTTTTTTCNGDCCKDGTCETTGTSSQKTIRSTGGLFPGLRIIFQ